MRLTPRADDDGNNLDKKGVIANLYGRYSGLLRHLLSRRYFQSDDIEDIIQESFLRLQKLEDPASLKFPKAFLYRTATNLMLDLKRKETVRSSVLIASKTQQEYANAVENIEAPRINPEQLAIERERTKALQSAIDALPAKCRTVFVLHKIHGWPHKRIAERLGITVPAVEKHMFRALKRCEASLRDLAD